MPSPGARFYVSKDGPRVELTDGVGTVDVAWDVWEDLVGTASLLFTRWALGRPLEYRHYLEYARRGAPLRNGRRRWPWRR